MFAGKQTFSASERIDNPGTQPLTLMVEPWGEDYTLQPGESCEVIAESSSARPTFSRKGGLDYVSIYIETPDDASFKVMQKGRELHCGHGRPGV